MKNPSLQSSHYRIALTDEKQIEVKRRILHFTYQRVSLLFDDHLDGRSHIPKMVKVMVELEPDYFHRLSDSANFMIFLILEVL